MWGRKPRGLYGTMAFELVLEGQVGFGQTLNPGAADGEGTQSSQGSHTGRCREAGEHWLPLGICTVQLGFEYRLWE